MLNALEDHARRCRYQRAELVTGPDQHPAIDLYQHAGYQPTGVERYGDLVGVRMAKQHGTEAEAR